jgi:hypothetical protein
VKKWLYLEFWWATHNLIAHPLSQLTWWLSLCGLLKPVNSFGNWLHDWTIPVHEHGAGRG